MVGSYPNVWPGLTNLVSNEFPYKNSEKSSLLPTVNPPSGPCRGQKHHSETRHTKLVDVPRTFYSRRMRQLRDMAYFFNVGNSIYDFYSDWPNVHTLFSEPKIVVVSQCQNESIREDIYSNHKIKFVLQVFFVVISLVFILCNIQCNFHPWVFTNEHLCLQKFCLLSVNLQNTVIIS